jgi:hypothetical protein
MRGLKILMRNVAYIAYLTFFVCSCLPEADHSKADIRVKIQCGKLNCDTLALVKIEKSENGCSIKEINITLNNKEAEDNDTIVVHSGDSIKCFASFNYIKDYNHKDIYVEYANTIVAPYPLHILSPNEGDTIIYGSNINVSWEYDSLPPSRLIIAWSYGDILQEHGVTGATAFVIDSLKQVANDTNYWPFLITLNGINQQGVFSAYWVDEISTLMKKN